MPKLKNLTCSVQWEGTGDALQELHAGYLDGRVDCLLAIPADPKSFSIRLTSDGFIAPGLAMFVYIDGIYQCNRNRQSLQVSDEDTPRECTEIDFHVRQKEEFRSDGTLWGKQWRFRKLNDQTSASSEDLDEAPDRGTHVGTIEVVVLRCVTDDSLSKPASIFRLPLDFYDTSNSVTTAASTQIRWLGGFEGATNGAPKLDTMPPLGDSKQPKNTNTFPNHSPATSYFQGGIASAAVASVQTALEPQPGAPLLSLGPLLGRGDTEPKPYWPSWKEEKIQSSSIPASSADTTWTLPSETIQKNMTTHQTVLDKPMPYMCRLARPKYIDSLQRPYAVFSFEYRDEKAVEKLLRAHVEEPSINATIDAAPPLGEQPVEDRLALEQSIHHPIPQQAGINPPQWTQTQEIIPTEDLGKPGDGISEPGHPATMVTSLPNAGYKEPQTDTGLASTANDLRPTIHDTCPRVQDQENVDWNKTGNTGSPIEAQQGNGSLAQQPAHWKDSFAKATGQEGPSTNDEIQDSNNASLKQSFEDPNGDRPSSKQNDQAQDSSAPQWGHAGSTSGWAVDAHPNVNMDNHEQITYQEPSSRNQQPFSAQPQPTADDRNISSGSDNKRNEPASVETSFETAKTSLSPTFDVPQRPHFLNTSLDEGFPSDRDEAQKQSANMWPSTFGANQQKYTYNPSPIPSHDGRNTLPSGRANRNQSPGRGSTAGFSRGVYRTGSTGGYRASDYSEFQRPGSRNMLQAGSRASYRDQDPNRPLSLRSRADSRPPSLEIPFSNHDFRNSPAVQNVRDTGSSHHASSPHNHHDHAYSTADIVGESHSSWNEYQRANTNSDGNRQFERTNVTDFGNAVTQSNRMRSPNAQNNSTKNWGTLWAGEGQDKNKENQGSGGGWTTNDSDQQNGNSSEWLGRGGGNESGGENGGRDGYDLNSGGDRWEDNQNGNGEGGNTGGADDQQW